MSNLDTTGLVDSGSSHCFIDPTYARDHNIPLTTIPPVTLRFLNGSFGEDIVQIATLPIRFSTDDVIDLLFYVTPLDSDSAFVFGHNWLRRYNPSIDWTAGQLLFFRRLPHSVPTSTRSGLNGSPDPPAPRLSTTTSTPSAPASASTSVPLGNSSSSTLLPSVSFINAAAYARAARLPGSTVFTLTVSASDTDPASVSGFSAKVEPIDLSKIPEEYHEFQDVFSKSKAGNLAPHRPYDLKIDLEENAQPPIGRMYPLSEHELEALRTFLDENLRTNFARPSRCAHGAPTLFVKKKDGGLRLPTGVSTKFQKKIGILFRLLLTC
jgi:hypothetical protein